MLMISTTMIVVVVVVVHYYSSAWIYSLYFYFISFSFTTTWINRRQLTLSLSLSPSLCVCELCLFWTSYEVWLNLLSILCLEGLERKNIGIRYAIRAKQRWCRISLWITSTLFLFKPFLMCRKKFNLKGGPGEVNLKHLGRNKRYYSSKLNVNKHGPLIHYFEVRFLLNIIFSVNTAEYCVRRRHYY